MRISAAEWSIIETELPTYNVESSLAAYVGLDDGSTAFYGIKSLEDRYCVMRT